SRACCSCFAKTRDINDQGGGGDPAAFFLVVETEESSMQKIWASILISTERMAGKVLKMWILAGLLTHSVTVANHI
ncbi:MAG TPA: hypothetical protein VJ323_09265, partial [Bryobacteraceae bacterium]|nr:hypothetical protein [Bryobacteraceae bacterium]